MTDEPILLEVGGCVRDELMGVPTNDVDFMAVFKNPSFEGLVDWLEDNGFTPFVLSPENLTVRAGVPKNTPLYNITKVADFVLPRKDGPSSDGRRPDFVVPGTIGEDLARRDFTVNAMARRPDGTIIDPFNGQKDLENNVLRFVGDPFERIAEDGLRVLRAFRFMVTKGFHLDLATTEALFSLDACEALGAPGISIERIGMELAKMFSHDTLRTLDVLATLPRDTQSAIFRDGMRLQPTLRQHIRLEE